MMIIVAFATIGLLIHAPWWAWVIFAIVALYEL
jgi:hypothetical protein